MKSLKKIKNKLNLMDQNVKNIYNEAIAEWVFKHGKSLHETGKYFSGINYMIRGLIANRSNFEYKIGILILSFFFSINTADSILKSFRNFQT